MLLMGFVIRREMKYAGIAMPVEAISELRISARTKLISEL
ncbi:hypothetical protein SDC9_89898 [bioreactor metagenome]|uniref:Uncharacterized protein n=1 Tax=bioreactor metagenome TaxID=1076179 RepID=A0A644ZQQ6_9ZZZZ